MGRWSNDGSQYIDHTVEVIGSILKEAINFDIIGLPVNIVAAGISTDWDNYFREIGNVLYCPWKANDKYMVVYTGHQGTYAENNVYVGLATSNDGITWTKKGKIITRSLEDPYLVYNAGKYYLFAEDKETVPFRGIRRYNSTDLVTWVDDGLVLDKGAAGSWDDQDVSSPVVFIENGVWNLLYEGRSSTQSGAVGLATSTDGLNFTKNGSNPVVIGNKPTVFSRKPDVTWSTNIVTDDILKVKDTYYLLVHGYPFNNNFVPIVLTSKDLVNWKDYLDVPIPLPYNESAEGGTVMISHDGSFKLHYNMQTGDRGIHQVQIKGITKEPVVIAQPPKTSSLSGIKIIDNKTALANNYIDSGYIDLTGCSEIAITARLDASVLHNGFIWWSNDGTQAQGKETFYGTDVTSDQLQPPPVFKVKAKFANIAVQNKAAADHVVNAWIRKTLE